MSEQRIKEKIKNMEKISSNAALVWSEKEAHEKDEKNFLQFSRIVWGEKAIRFIFALETQEMRKELKEKKIKIPSKNKEIRNKFTGQFWISSYSFRLLFHMNGDEEQIFLMWQSSHDFYIS